MYDNKQYIEETIKFIHSQPMINNVYTKELLEQVIYFVNKRLNHESDYGIGTLDEQKEWFDFLLDLTKEDAYNGHSSPRNLMLYCWAMDSKNVYAKIYLLGYIDGTMRFKYIEEKVNNKKVLNATNGRRLIGATTRERVKKEAEAFRQMSKGDAAYEIAKIIGKDSGHVKRYLSELFPGDKWKTTKQ